MTFLHLLPEAWALSPQWAGGAVLVGFAFFFVVEEFTVFHACGKFMGHCSLHGVGYSALAAFVLHGLGDGLVMAFSFQSSYSLGVAVSAAIIVHKFSDGMTLASLFLGAGSSHKKVMGLVLTTALATPVGLAVGMSASPWITPHVLAVFLGLAAGGFLFIGTADILPRLHRTRDVLCWVFLLLGMGVSFFVSH
jgi:zinc transporter ZupT